MDLASFAAGFVTCLCAIVALAMCIGAKSDDRSMMVPEMKERMQRLPEPIKFPEVAKE